MVMVMVMKKEYEPRLMEADEVVSWIEQLFRSHPRDAAGFLV
jgi:hypothetical protein